jgi:hypothetical protein
LFLPVGSLVVNPLSNEAKRTVRCESEDLAMPVTLIYDERSSTVPDAVANGDDLWLSFADLTVATAWEYKPEGLCLGDRCVPLPASRDGEFIDADGRFNLAAFARFLEQPVVHDDIAGVWLFGESATARTRALRSLDAPDFRLPDLDGNLHALSDYRGKKVLLLSWASW